MNCPKLAIEINGKYTEGGRNWVSGFYSVLSAE
jgi:hypothetical protein